MGYGDTCRRKDTRFINLLVTMEVPENGHVGIKASPPGKGVRIKSPAEVHLHESTFRLIQRYWGSWWKSLWKSSLSLFPPYTSSPSCLGRRGLDVTPSTRKAGLWKAGTAWPTWYSFMTEGPTYLMRERHHVVYLGFRKAFVTISHRIFWEKLAAHGLDSALFNE